MFPRSCRIKEGEECDGGFLLARVLKNQKMAITRDILMKLSVSLKISSLRSFTLIGRRKSTYATIGKSSLHINTHHH